MTDDIRRQVMRSLRAEGWGDGRIAQRFGISRQRVHQLLGRTRRTGQGLRVDSDLPVRFSEIARLARRLRFSAGYVRDCLCGHHPSASPRIFRAFRRKGWTVIKT